MLKKIFFSAMFFCFVQITPPEAQYINLEGNNPAIMQYVEADENNWNKSIMYVFYSDQPCPLCSEAMGQIYDIYEEYYTNQFSLFEIDYTDEDEFGMQESYDLSQPLSIVLVRIQDGQSRGYYKIDNPQDFINDEFYFKERLITEINNFLST